MKEVLLEAFKDMSAEERQAFIVMSISVSVTLEYIEDDED